MPNLLSKLDGIDLVLANAHAYVFCLLTATSVAYQVVFRRWERFRRAVSNNHVPDVLSTWTFAAVVALPLSWAIAAIAVYYLPDWNPRSTGAGRRSVQIGKFLYSIAAVEAGVTAASVLLRSFGPLAVVAAVPAFIVINFGMVVLAVLVSDKRRALPMLLRPKSHALEIAGHCLGATLGLAMVWHVLLILAAPPLLAVLHLVASRDAVLATGAFSKEQQAWNAEAWQFRANEMLSDSGYCSAIVVDMNGSTEPQRVNILRSSVGPTFPVGAIDGHYVVFAATESVWAADLLVARIERWLDTAGVCVTVGVASGLGRTPAELVRAALLDLAVRRQADSAAAGA